jgi:glutamate synthase domain-containing protein 3
MLPHRLPRRQAQALRGGAAANGAGARRPPARHEGSAGQSFGTFLTAGIRLILEGEANDYVSKGTRGGEIIVKPAANHHFAAGNNSIIGKYLPLRRDRRRAARQWPRG